jgi:hypothetical protein
VKVCTGLLLACFFLLAPILSDAAVLFKETFDDGNLQARGWYDNANPVLSTKEAINGRSLEFHYPKGAIKPLSGNAMRKKFSSTDAVYISYYVKYSANWVGSNKKYHPHEFYLLTNKDGDWAALANTNLTTYIEQNGGVPMLLIQDSRNIDQNRIGQNLTSVTEWRGVAGCNGDSDGYGAGDCYKSGTIHRNGKSWRANGKYFADSPGPYYKNNWNHVEVYLKLNSIINGKGVADGIMQYWINGERIMDFRNVVFRTGKHSDMKFNQFIIGPYIGDGSPVDQTFWIDDLVVGTSRPAASTPPPGTNTSPIANAGLDQQVPTGSLVTLDGSGSSDADGDQLTFNWSFISRPGGSTAELSDASAMKPTFVADVVGEYVLDLIVKDGKEDSTADTVTITSGDYVGAPKNLRRLRNP